MSIDGSQLSDDIKANFEQRMEDSIGQPYLDAKANLDNFAESFSHAVGEEVALVAAGASYTPATPGDWSGNPADAIEALDRLAAAVAGLLGGPIP
jgi:hypothetical protein